MNILRTENIYKSFGAFLAVNGVNLEVQKRSIHSIIGPNGAGKTTFFNVITGKYKPTRGKVFFNEHDITGQPSYKIAKYGLARTFQIVNIFNNLTVRENICIPLLNKHKKNFTFFSAPQNFGAMKEEKEKILHDVGLESVADNLAGSLSHGDKKKLDIGIGLARGPVMLLLDEPMAGLNPQETEAILKLIKTIRDNQDLTIVMIEHDMNAVFSISEKITVFQQGAVIAEGEPEVIKNDPVVIKAYLGEEF